MNHLLPLFSCTVVFPKMAVTFVTGSYKDRYFCVGWLLYTTQWLLMVVFKPHGIYQNRVQTSSSLLVLSIRRRATKEFKYYKKVQYSWKLSSIINIRVQNSKQQFVYIFIWLVYKNASHFSPALTVFAKCLLNLTHRPNKTQHKEINS